MKIFILSILFIFLACNNNKTENKVEVNSQKKDSKSELHLKDILIRNQNFILKKLKLKSIGEINSKTLRIWRFPGGGAIFEEIYDINIEKKELKFYSYLIEDEKHLESKDLSKLEYEKIIKNKDLINKFIKFSNENLLLKFKNIEEYCGNNFGCGDSYLVEYKDNFGQNSFGLNDGIKKCSNKNAESSKELLSLIEEIIAKYGN